PSVAWIAPWNQPNWITTEFSLLYRWHSLVPDVIKWDGIPHPVMTTLFNNQLLIRKGLAAAFVDMSAQAAGKLGPFNVPQELKEIEAGGIIQNRVCRLQPYAAYREYCS